ncbi:uncharacterized protein [Heterodontus francisci]|uniref:uncharacterized protein isoform X2 n=1 Tax=Heterodontus francisci TaxID=7792 RepID=UPI00355C5C31
MWITARKMSIACTEWVLTVAEGIWVEQNPESLTVSEGGTANLTCAYSVDKTRDFVINWLHQPRKQKNQTYVYYMDSCKNKQSIRLVNTKDHERNINQLTITHLQQEDSGTYFCELMILSAPSTEDLKGNGSRLLVTASDPSKSKDSWHYLLLCLLVIFVILLLTLYSWKAKRKRLVEYRASTTDTIPEDTSRSDRITYATLSPARMKETPQNVNLEIVYSDPLIERKAPNTTAKAKDSAAETCKTEPKAQSGNEEQMLYSHLQFKAKNEAQFLTPCLQ